MKIDRISETESAAYVMKFWLVATEAVTGPLRSGETRPHSAVAWPGVPMARVARPCAPQRGVLQARETGRACAATAGDRHRYPIPDCCASPRADRIRPRFAPGRGPVAPEPSEAWTAEGRAEASLLTGGADRGAPAAASQEASAFLGWPPSAVSAVMTLSACGLSHGLPRPLMEPRGVRPGGVWGPRPTAHRSLAQRSAGANPAAHGLWLGAPVSGAGDPPSAPATPPFHCPRRRP